MRTGTSFARDWQLLKIARSLRGHDVTGPLVRRLLADASSDTVDRVAAIAEKLGEEDGTSLLARNEARFDPPTLMEGLLLMWGIPCDTREAADGSMIITVGGDGAALRETFADARVAAPYLAGYARALQPDAVLADDTGRITFRFPPRGR